MTKSAVRAGPPRPAARPLRRLLAVVLAAAAVTALTDPRAPLGSTPPVLHAVADVVLAVALASLVRCRVREVATERDVWRWLGLGVVVLAAGAVVEPVLVACGLPAGTAAAALPAAAVAACLPLYQGLVRWNRFRTEISDPGDWLNGVCAVLALVALGDAVLDRTGSPLPGWTGWELQLMLLRVASGLVLLGTAGSVAVMGGLLTDVRAALVAAALGVPPVALAVAAAAGAPPEALLGVWSEAGWVLTAVLLGASAVRAPAPVRPRSATPAAPTIGAVAVVLASTAVLAGDRRHGLASPSVWCAVLAVTGASVQLLRLVEGLSSLAQSRREALTDDLTGLANRRALVRRLGEVQASGTPVALVLLDLDRFKEVNDGLGHAAGDDLLRMASRRLEALVGPGDLMARLGGDEFALVLRGATTRSASDRARAVTRALAEPFGLGGMGVHVAASIGVAACPEHGTDAVGLLRQADAAMYDAKRTARPVVVYDPVVHDSSQGTLAVVEDLRTALATGQLRLHYQPQVDIVTGRVVGAEALVRWEHPTRGLLEPAVFLGLAEQHGLMGALTEEVLRQAVAQAAAWAAAGNGLRLSVNLSASNLLDRRLPARVAELLADTGVAAGALVLEVTESVLMADPERSLRVVRALADLGTTVSIDDYGTGYSSLAYVRQLPVGEIKLDRSFTADLLDDPRAAAIVVSTIDLAHALGLRIVAEGVEDEATLQRLRDLGCDESQGFHHGRPVPAAEFDRRWTARPQVAPAR